MAEGGPDNGGHRARLRQRLFEGHGGALLDHELVEYLLTLAVPRHDTKPMAKRLIAQFGGIGPLLGAAPEVLSREGLSEGIIGALTIAEATAIIIVHNHPSGDPSPSRQDIILTKELIEAERHMKIVVHDHVIVGAQGRSSMRALCLI